MPELPPEQIPTRLMETTYAPPADGNAESSSLPEGQPFGRYRLLAKLGQGGMGQVWKAYDTQLKRVVALKQIRPDKEEPAAAERFLREAQAAARLRHPNIIGVLDDGVFEGHHYLTTEYVEGRSLDEVIAAQPLSVRKAVELGKQVAEALAYAHIQGIVHRDLKPANLLLDAEGKAFVMDFGLAKDMTGELGRRLTASGHEPGTPAYKSPEQALARSEAVGPPSDQFSLGVVLYELLTGRLPFDGTSELELVTAIVRKDPVSPTRVNPLLHRDLETICLKALEKDPLRRYESMAALAADLGRWMEGEPIAARPVSLWERTARKAIRNRRVLMPIALVLLAALAWSMLVVSHAYSRQKAEADASRMLADARGPLEEAQRFLCQEGGDYARMRARIETSKRIIEDALVKAPSSVPGHDLLGQAWRLLGSEEKAEACWREATHLDPGFGPAHFHLGMLLLSRAVVLQAIVFPGFADEEREGQAAKLVALARPELDAAAKCYETMDDEITKATLGVVHAFVSNRKSDVIEQATAAITRLKDGPGCDQFHLMIALVSEGTTHRAELDRALQICPGNTLARFKRGRIRHDEKDYDGAIKDYSVAITVDPGFADALNNRGGTHAAMKNLVAAIDDFTKALDINRRHVGALVNRGVAWKHQGNADLAIADFNEALTLVPDCAAVYVNLGNAHRAKRDLKSALADFDHAIAIDPHMGIAYVDRSLARLDNKDPDGAIADCDRALAEDPHFEGAYVNRSSAYLRKGMWN